MSTRDNRTPNRFALAGWQAMVVIGLLIALILAYFEVQSYQRSQENPPTAALPSTNVAKIVTATITSTSTPILTQPPTLTNTPTDTPTSTPTFTPTNPPKILPSPTPTPITGVVTTYALRVRSGPGMDFSIIRHLTKDDVVVVLRRTRAGDWVEIEWPEHQTGWIATNNIRLFSNLNDIEVATNLPSASSQIANNRAIIPGGNSIRGTLAAGQTHWYQLTTISNEVFFVLFYEPSTIAADQIEMAFKKEKSDEPDNIGIADVVIGRAGLIYPNTTLLPGQLYYLRVLNKSSETIYYCLAPKDVPSWDCQ